MIDPQKFSDELFELYSIPAFYKNRLPENRFGREIKSQKLLIENKSILFGKINPKVPKIWFAASKENLRKLASTEFIPLSSSQKIFVKFLFHLCNSSFILYESKSLTKGSTPSRKRVDEKAFLMLPIPLPSLLEQREIAAILSIIDTAIEKTDSIIQKILKMRQALMQKLFREGIGHQVFKESEIVLTVKRT